MKIGVITFFDNGNYGSELQAIATKEFCSSRGHDVTFLRIYSSCKFIRFLNRLSDRFTVWYNCKKDASYRKCYRDRLNNRTAQPTISKELARCIHNSVSREIKTGNIAAWHMRHFSPYDCYVCGSDQVWSALRIPVWKTNFLPGVSPMRKIAYAPSIDINDVPEHYIRTVAPLVRDFEFLSVREESAAKVFKECMGVSPRIVVDPTILVGCDTWERILSKEGLEKPKNNYIFCYFLGDLQDAQIEFLNNYAGDREVIILPYEHHSKRLNKGKYVLADQFEFINYLRYADYVFTDSFHATVFSLLFNKEFSVFQRSHIGLTKQTSRIESLLSMVHLENRLVSNVNEVESFQDIDYSKINKILDFERSKSIEYFENALNKIQSNI